MADFGRLGAAAAVLALLVASPVASQQLGDFGRVKPGVINDDILPALDYLGKFLTNQPHSSFNLTDEEDEMHDRVWRFLVAPHAKDWAFEYGWEIHEARTGNPQALSLDRYYYWLSDARYASSRARYNAIGEHVAWDLGTLPKVFHVICVVIDIDRQRAVAAEGVANLELQMIKEQRGRAAENDAYVTRFVGALGYRYASYDYALNHLLVATPHHEALAVNDKLNQLAVWVDRADNSDFCGDDWPGGDSADGGIRSRVLMDAPSEGEYRK